MEPPTKPMLEEAAEAGFYQPPGLTNKYPRLQILIAELLAGKQVVYPRLLDVTYKKAPKAKGAVAEQIPLAVQKLRMKDRFERGPRTRSIHSAG